MEYTKTQEHNTRIDVYFDGVKYVFISAFHGIVAVARRLGLVEFLPEGSMAHVKFQIEKTTTINKNTITRIIHQQENNVISTVVECEWTEVERESLPYFVSVNLEKMG